MQQRREQLEGVNGRTTEHSPDAGLVGNTLGPDMAYRFARGEEVTSRALAS